MSAGLLNSIGHRNVALAAFCLATVLLIPLEQYVAGAVVWAVALAAVLRGEAPFRRRMGVLLAVIAMLAASPIHTDRNNLHFITIGIPFCLAVCGPHLLFRKSDPGVINWRFFPRRFSWLDILYTAISVPLAWGVIYLYFFKISPHMPTQWPMPAVQEQEAFWQLFFAINSVGIWDELFFINVVYAVLRSMFSPRVANLGQAVVYASVLNDMAFTGIGPIVVFAFALTQGSMYEKSRCLLYVLLVHIIVDFFLIRAILQYHYPGMPLTSW